MADSGTGRSSAGEVVGLAEALAALGRELAAAQNRTELSQFEVADVEVAFEVAATADAEGRLRIWAVNTEGFGDAHTASHRVTLRLKRRIASPQAPYPGPRTEARRPARASTAPAPPVPARPPSAFPARPTPSWEEGGPPR